MKKIGEIGADEFDIKDQRVDDRADNLNQFVVWRLLDLSG
jgi:hypothetical protein